MKIKLAIAGSALLFAAGLAGCASDGSLALSTGSIGDAENSAQAQRIDPACVSLMARIDELRKEGTPERLAKVATGKSKTANVKRSALARMSELDKANSEFQQKCSTLAAPKPAKPAASPQKTAAASSASAKTAGAAKTATQKAAASTAATQKAATAATKSASAAQ